MLRRGKIKAKAALTIRRRFCTMNVPGG